MRILVLDEDFPWPLNTGKRLRSFHLLSRIAKRHDLRYVAYGVGSSEACEVLARAKMQPFPIEPSIPPKSGFFFYLRLLWNLFSRQPYIVQSLSSAVYAKEVERQIDEFQPDVVISESIFYASYFSADWHCKTIVSTHNVESDIWRRYAEHEPNPLKRLYILNQYRKVLRFEHSTMNEVDAAIAVSEADAQRLSEMNSKVPVEIIDNGVDLEYFRPRKRGGTLDNQHLVFVGSMDWRPNQDAFVFFAEEILSRLRSRLPDIEVSFVGRNPPPDIRHAGIAEGVEITGTVEDVRPYYEKATVCIVPLRIGGGSRLKILESFAVCCPVVSTSVGAEGLDAIDGETLLIGDSPAQFADQVIRVMEDAELAQALVRNGRELVEARYGWDPLAARTDELIKRIYSD